VNGNAPPFIDDPQLPAVNDESAVVDVVSIAQLTAHFAIQAVHIGGVLGPDAIWTWNAAPHASYQESPPPSVNSRSEFRQRSPSVSDDLLESVSHLNFDAGHGTLNLHSADPVEYLAPPDWTPNHVTKRANAFRPPHGTETSPGGEAAPKYLSLYDKPEQMGSSNPRDDLFLASSSAKKSGGSRKYGYSKKYEENFFC
jgi:hypothetical protein